LAFGFSGELRLSFPSKSILLFYLPACLFRFDPELSAASPATVVRPAPILPAALIVLLAIIFGAIYFGIVSSN